MQNSQLKLMFLGVRTSMLGLMVAMLLGVGLPAAMGQSAEPVATDGAVAEPVVQRDPTLEAVAGFTAEKRIAALVTSYHPGSHAAVIVSPLLNTDTLDGKGRQSTMKLASLYTDQIHERDLSRALAAEHGFQIYDSIEGALTLGTGKLAVDGVLLVAEHGTYPLSETGNRQYPKRRMFEAVVKVFEASGQVVPIFHDKHIADSWADIEWIYNKAKELKIPMMAGSSVPGTWRKPAADVVRGADLKELVVLSYHTLDGYGFHAMEMVHALAERRKGGETGVAWVQTLSDDAVWAAFEEPTWDPKLMEMARAVLPRDRTRGRPLSAAVRNPTLFIMHFNDGFRAYVFTLNGAVGEWSGAWKTAESDMQATWFSTQEALPYFHFALLGRAVERMMHTGKPTWPVERTVLSSGALDALLISRHQGGKRLETPWLKIPYTSDWDWQQPAPAPPDQPRPRR